MTIFNESKDFRDRLDVVEANQYGALKTKGSSGVDLRLFAAWVRGIGYWPPPAELLAMADEHEEGKQKTPTTAEESTNVERRAHNKRVTEARNHKWQEDINALAREHPKESHSERCRKLAKLDPNSGVKWRTIQRNTKLGHS